MQPVTVTLFALDDVAVVWACNAAPTPVAETSSTSPNVFMRPPIEKRVQRVACNENAKDY
jgi:hypothetical protein